MATYTVTTSNWNSPAFWSAINHGSSGHTLDFSSLPASYSVTYDTDNNQAVLSDGATTFIIGDVGHTGTPDVTLGGATEWDFFTTLTFGNSSNYVAAGYNGEVITCGTGDDTIYANGGADVVDAGDGDNVVYGGADNDTLTTGTGNDQLHGGDGDDSITSGAGDDFIDADEGADFVDAGSGSDTIYGGWGGGLSDTIYAGAGNDLVFAGDGADFVYGEADTDWIDGNDGDDYIDGGAGNDRLVGQSGNDTILGGTSGDTLTGGAGSDSLVGGDGADDIYGAAGDTVDGGEGGTDNDTLHVSGVSSISYGTAESGTVFFTAGGSLTFSNIETVVTLSNDGIVSGTSGADSMGQFYKDADGDWILNNDATGFAGTTGDDDYVLAGDGNDSIWTGNGDDIIYGEGDDDYVSADSGHDTVYGGAGNDTIYAEWGLDYVDGGAGDDLIDGGEEADTIFGNDGADTITGGSGNDSLDGDNVLVTGGADSILGEDGDDTIIGDTGDDTLDGGTGADDIYAGDDNDSVLGGSGDDFLLGQTGADIIAAGADNDTVLGGDDDDTISGGTGDDSLSGEGGNDTFIYAAGDGADTITDFNTGNTGTLTDGNNTNNDFIDLSGFYDNLSELYADQADDGILNQSNTLDDKGRAVDFSDNTQFGSGSLTLTGVPANNTGFTFENTGITCFTTGTAIRTPRGDVLIDDLKIGDLVTTLDNGSQPIRWISRQSLDITALAENERIRPVLIGQGVLGNARDLLVSQQHGVLLGRTGETLVRAKYLTKGRPGIRIAHGKRKVTYMHLLFDSHQIIFSEGIATESFYPGPMALASLNPDALAEFRMLFPDANIFAEAFDPEQEFGATARRFGKVVKNAA